MPIWRDPWMVVGPRTYADDVLATPRDRQCLRAMTGRSRYPRVALDDLLDARPDFVVLPDEPYPFSPDDGPEAFPGVPHRPRLRSCPHLVRAGHGDRRRQLRPVLEQALGRALGR